MKIDKSKSLIMITYEISLGLKLLAKGPYTNYVYKILKIFEPLPLCTQAFYIDIWQTPFPLSCLHSLCMAPKVFIKKGQK